MKPKHKAARRPRSHAAAAFAGTLIAAWVHAAPTAPADQPAASQPSTQPAEMMTTLSEPENKHIDRQGEVALDRVNATLDATPPAVGPVPPDRAIALTLLDTVLHEPFAPGRLAVAKFRLARTQRAIEQMQRTRVTDDGVVIWQIYNMGFVVRTKSVTLGFDLVKMMHLSAFSLDNATMRAIVDQCDVLFVSHEHLDHADHDVAQMFLDAGKPVLAPDAMWRGEPIHDHLTHLPRDGDAAGHVFAVGLQHVPLRVSIFAGFQALKDGTSVENNVYVVNTPEGRRIAHTGDNNIAGGLPSVGAIAPVDVLFMKLIPDDLKTKNVLAPFAAKLVVPSHLEEIGHERLNAREPYWRCIERMTKVDTPSVVMTWGECFRYEPPPH